MYQIIQGETCAVFRQIYFTLEDTSLSALTGKSVSAGNFGIVVGASTFTSCAGTVGELGRGIYIYTPVVAEVSTLGLGVLAGTYTSALDIKVPFQVVPSIAVSTNGKLEVIAFLKTSAISTGAIDTSVFTPSKFDSTHYAQIASVNAAAILTTPSQKLVTTALGYVGVAVVATGAISAASFASSAITSGAIDSTAYAAMVDAIVRRNIEGGSNTGRTIGDVLAVMRNRVDITGTGSSRTLNVYAADDTSVKWTASVGLSARDSFQTFDPS